MSVTHLSARRRRIALVAYLVAAIVAFATTALLDLDVSAAERAVNPFTHSPGWQTAAPGLVVAGLAAVVLERSPNWRMGALLVGFGMFLIFDGLAEAYVANGTRGAAAWPGTTAALWFFGRLGSLILVAIPTLLTVYPTGRFLPGRWGKAARISVLIMLGGAVVFMIGPAHPLPPGAHVPAGLALQPTALPVDPVAFDHVARVVYAAAFASSTVAVATVWRRHRSASGLERLRMRWLLWAAVMVVLVAIAVNFFPDPSVQAVFGGLLVLLPSVAVTIGLVAPGLGAIDRLLSGTLVYGALAVLVVGLDLLVLSTVTSVVGDALDQRTVVLLVLLASTVFYAPLRVFLLRVVRRLLLGRRDDPFGVAAGLAASLERVDDPADQLQEIVDAVARAFRVSYVSVEVDRSRGERLTATRGRPPAAVRILPVTYRQAEVGRLILPRQKLRGRLSDQDEALLGDLVRQTAIAARSARLADDLQDSRERLILAREEERRRIRRDLHDGLGPALSGVVFRLEAVRLQVRDNPSEATTGLTVARDQVRDVVADVRRLVHDLRPPALDDLGLLAALQQQADRLATPELQLRVHGDLIDALPAAVEVAAFRIAGEAMTNAARHAHATRCHVHLTASQEQLVLDICDDGRGIDPRATAGLGLVSLRERAAELGGHSEVTCPEAGGTQVRAWLPLRTTS